ncbi:MAG: cytochrome P450 [Deltaproteobacteria bacterium]|nr:cytochrome P450 [Deltaproteobacteria bacterium]
MIDFDPYSHRFQDDPYPVYRRLRDEAPVHWCARARVFSVTRHEDLRQVFKDPERFSSETRRLNRFGRSQTTAAQRVRILWRVLTQMRQNPLKMRDSRMLIMEDPPVHGQMRSLVNRGFTRRRIAQWEGRIRELVDECMERIRQQESFDLVTELAIPLPVTVISELLGVSAEDRHLFKRWSDNLIEGATGSAIENPIESGILDTLAELTRYMKPVIRARREKPREDLISVLVDETADDAGLDEFEIVMFILLLLVAGNETTTNLLGNCVDALLDPPAELEKVVADPSLVPALVEETLRFDAPVQQLRRVVRGDTELAGVKLPAGSELLLFIGSANRDERIFEDPDRFDVGRDTRGHLGFGLGNHFCLGSNLARLEAKAALEALVPELPKLARLRSERDFIDSFTIRGRARLELRRAA